MDSLYETMIIRDMPAWKYWVVWKNDFVGEEGLFYVDFPSAYTVKIHSEIKSNFNVIVKILCTTTKPHIWTLKLCPQAFE